MDSFRLVDVNEAAVDGEEGIGVRLVGNVGAKLFAHDDLPIKTLSFVILVILFRAVFSYENSNNSPPFEIRRLLGVPPTRLDKLLFHCYSHAVLDESGHLVEVGALLESHDRRSWR